MKAIGRTLWAIAGGRIPLQSTGREPDFTSRDELSLLNTGGTEASVEITIFYADRDPVGPYRVTIGARRTRTVRINDLIDPEAVPLETDYAGVVESDLPIVVQFNRLDSRQAENAVTSTLAYPV